MGRRAGAHLAPLLRCAAARGREPEGHRGARSAVFRAGDSAARAARRARADLGARQFAARADHGAGASHAGADFEARARHRRADCLPAQRGFDRRLAARSGGVRLVMPEHKIEPHSITRPIQLLAAWLVGLTVTNGSFLGAAVSLGSGSWERSALVMAAIANVPLFLIAL